MRPGRAPDYQLIKAHGEILPAGAFVRPIEYCYVPADTLERLGAIYIDQSSEVVCYTRAGCLVISRSNIKQV